MDRLLTPEESIVEILAADCRVHEHRGCSGCKTLATIDDLKDAKECWGGTAKLIANYYETEVLPQKIKEAEKKLIEEIKGCGYQQFDRNGLATDNIKLATQRVYHVVSGDIKQWEKSRGIA
jgi:hypothetical protein